MCIRDRVYSVPSIGSGSSLSWAAFTIPQTIKAKTAAPPKTDNKAVKINRKGKYVKAAFKTVIARLYACLLYTSGRGVMEDKIIKNMFASEYIWHDIKYAKTVGIVDENDMEGYVEVAEPVGVVAGVTPVTNPKMCIRDRSIPRLSKRRKTFSA